MPVGNTWTCRDRVSKALLVFLLVRCLERSGQWLAGMPVEKRVIHDGIPDRRMLVWSPALAGEWIGIRGQPESLILAQNERWRHA